MTDTSVRIVAPCLRGRKSYNITLELNIVANALCVYSVNVPLLVGVGWGNTWNIYIRNSPDTSVKLVGKATLTVQTTTITLQFIPVSSETCVQYVRHILHSSLVWKHTFYVFIQMTLHVYVACNSCKVLEILRLTWKPRHWWEFYCCSCIPFSIVSLLQ